MKYFTQDIGIRAADIADREAERQCREKGSYEDFFEVWLLLHQQLLREFATQ